MKSLSASKKFLPAPTANRRSQSDKDILFEDFLIEYFLPFAEQNHSKATFNGEVGICKAAMPFFKGKNLRQIKAADVEKFKSKDRSFNYS